MTGRVRTAFTMLFALALCLVMALPALGAENTGEVATEDEYGGREEVETGGMTPIYGDEIADGTYSITVETDTSMFNVTDCILTVEDGKMSAVITLASDGYQWIYMGSAEEAASASEDACIPYIINEDNRYTYAIDEVPALNAKVTCSSFSKRRQQWYEHDIVFLAATLPSSALSDEAKQAVKDASPVSDLADGTYTIAVDASGEADDLKTPATMEMHDGEATITLEWENPSYDYMIVDGERISREDSSEGSVFKIAGDVFDTPMTVFIGTGESEVMSSLSFHSGMIEPVSVTSPNEAGQETSAPSTGLIAGISAIVAGAVVVLVLTLRHRRREKGGE